MKRLLFLSLSLLGLFSLALAQRPSFKPQAHQVELQLGTIHSLLPGADAMFVNDQLFAFNPVSGLRYTYHYSLSHGFRAGFQRLSGLHGDANGPQWQKIQNEFSLGYVYKYHIQRSQLYFAVDAIFEPGKIIDQSGRLESLFARAFGGKAGLGYRFFFSPYLSFGLEGNLKYIADRFPDPLRDPGYAFYQAQELSWQAQATLSFHFVKMQKRCTCPTVGKSKYR